MSSSRKHNESYIITANHVYIGGKMAETSTLSSGLSSASVGLSCESSSDATSFSVVNVLEPLKVPRLVLCLQCYTDCAFGCMSK